MQESRNPFVDAEKEEMLRDHGQVPSGPAAASADTTGHLRDPRLAMAVQGNVMDMLRFDTP